MSVSLKDGDGLCYRLKPFDEPQILGPALPERSGVLSHIVVGETAAGAITVADSTGTLTVLWLVLDDYRHGQHIDVHLMAS